MELSVSKNNDQLKFHRDRVLPVAHPAKDLYFRQDLPVLCYPQDHSVDRLFLFLWLLVREELQTFLFPPFQICCPICF